MTAPPEAAAPLVRGRRSLGRIAQGLSDDRRFIALAAAALIAVRAASAAIGTLVGPVASIPPSAHVLGPAAHWLQASVPRAVGVPAFGAVYVLVFIAMLVIVPLALVAADRRQFHRYTMALILAYSISLSLHILIGSVRPGMDPASGIAPLLYGDAFWGPISANLMGRGSSFPSTHVTVVAVMCMAAWGLRRFRFLPLAVLAVMSAAVLYLGVHWPLDVAAGMIIGAGSYLAIVVVEKNAGGRGFIRRRPG